MTDQLQPETLASAASGDSVTADALEEPAGERALYQLLEPDEQPQYLLRGRILDIVDREAQESESGRRSRKVAGPGTELRTLVTDERFLIVVPREEVAAERLTVPLSTVDSVDAEDAPGGSQRLRVYTDETAYYIDTSQSDTDEVRAVQEFVSDLETPAEPTGSSEGVLDTLERLADLHERGALTDEEFDQKKSELLDRL
jgi:hypothetical protein